jgi:hypothetical protein
MKNSPRSPAGNRALCPPAFDAGAAGIGLFQKRHTLSLGERGQQNAEQVRQPRSRIVQVLNVPQRVCLGPSLATALLDRLFEHYVGVFSYCVILADCRIFRVPK